MKRSAQQLRDDLLAIWLAGLDAVRSEPLVRRSVRVEGETLHLGEAAIDLAKTRRIAVVGGGKAGAGMAEGLENALGPALMDEKQLTGWLNVPADCVRPLGRIHLHAARPAGVNEPRPEGVVGTEKILEIAGSLGPEDLCICLLSGGGSALMPAPVAPIDLADKLAVTQRLSAAGADIEQLNTVRKQLSRIKGGGLARSCRAGRMVTLIISDVIGDPLDVIASGPTVENSTTALDALDVLHRFDPAEKLFPEAVYRHLNDSVAECSKSRPAGFPCRVDNLVLANNALAVDAAGVEAERRGYSHAMLVAGRQEPTAEEVGRHLAAMTRRMRSEPGPDCLITGGEPTVKLVPAEDRGLGGRNQQLVLAALQTLLTESREKNPAEGLSILSGGTDGEDGPTDAAGAWLDAELVRRMRSLQLEPGDFLRRNDAYRFFQQAGGLLKTGPTHTNVCDLRVALVDRVASE